MIIFGFSAVQLVYNWRTGCRECLPHTVRGLVIRDSLYWCFTAGFSLFLFIYLFIFFTEFAAYSTILKQPSREIRRKIKDRPSSITKQQDQSLSEMESKQLQFHLLHFCNDLPKLSQSAYLIVICSVKFSIHIFQENK